MEYCLSPGPVHPESSVLAPPSQGSLTGQGAAEGLRRQTQLPFLLKAYPYLPPSLPPNNNLKTSPRHSGAHAFNPSCQVAEAGGSLRVQG